MNARPFKPDSQAIQTHLAILQGVIERMAASSASAKAWCITLVSAILVIVTDNARPSLVLIALIPTALFFALDAYYLALERGFRKSYQRFVERLHRETLEESDLYSVEPTGALGPLFAGALTSLSIWPLYLTLVVMTFLADRLL